MFVYMGERVFFTHRREYPSVICRNGMVGAGGSSFDIQRRVLSLHIGEGAALLSTEEADSFGIQRRECLPYTGERVSIYYMWRRQTPSLYRGFHLLYAMEADSFSIQTRESEGECLLDTQERE